MKDQISIITDENFKSEIERIKTENIKRVSIRDLFSKKNINFLYEVKDIIEELTADSQCIEDFSVLNQLTNLKSFSIGDVRSGDDINLSNFKMLEGIGISSFKKIIHLEVLNNIETLYLSNGKCSFSSLLSLPILENLKKIVVQYYSFSSSNIFEGINAPNIRELELINLKEISFSGIEKFPNISTIKLNRINRIEYFESMAKLNKLELLEITNCKDIPNYKSIGDILSLLTLRIDNIGVIEDTSFLNNLDKLKFLAIIDSPIAHGNIKELMKIPSLEYLGIYPVKRFYNITEKELDKFNKN